MRLYSRKGESAQIVNNDGNKDVITLYMDVGHGIGVVQMPVNCLLLPKLFDLANCRQSLPRRRGARLNSVERKGGPSR